MKSFPAMKLLFFSVVLQACSGSDGSSGKTSDDIPSNDAINSNTQAEAANSEDDTILVDGVLHQIWKHTDSLSHLKEKINAGIPSDINQVYQTTTSGDQILASTHASRMITRITATDSGIYQFYIASDDHSELFFSALGQPMEKIASVKGHTRFQRWTQQGSQQSKGIQLDTGQVYQLEALHVDTGGNNHLSIGWGKNAEAITVISDIKMQHEQSDDGVGDTAPAICGAVGDWGLDNELSQLSFVTTKNTHIVESHQFNSLSGDISGDIAKITAHLGSVNTGIALRDERIIEHLFQVLSNPVATATVKVPSIISTLKVGESISENLTLSLELHGTTNDMTSEVILHCISQDMLMVKTLRPILISSKDYGLTAGIEILRDLAGLSSIAPVVPVDLVLIYKR